MGIANKRYGVSLCRLKNKTVGWQATLRLLYVWRFRPEFTFPVALVRCLLVYRRHDNIQRLWRGQEERIWGKKSNKK